MGEGLATKLKNLWIQEVSGVTDAANESEGWIVMKSKTPMTPEEASIFKSLTGDGEPAVDSVPELARRAAHGDVEAAEQLRKQIPDDDVFVQKVRDAMPVDQHDEVIEISSQLLDQQDAVIEIITKLVERIERVESAATSLARKSLDGQEDNEQQPAPPSTFWRWS